MRNRSVRTATPRRWQLLVCLAGAVLLTGCSGIFSESDGDSASPSPTRDENTSPGALQTQWMTVRNWVRVDLLALDRTSPKVVTVRFRLTNTGDETFRLGDKLGYTGYGTFESDASAVTLADAVALKRYYPYHSTDGDCVCSDPDDDEIPPGESMEIFASYPEPSSDRVAVMVPNTPAFLAVPIGDKQGPVKPGASQPTRDAAELELDDPDIQPITGRSEAVDGSREEEQDDDEVEVRLASDVLFALNKANLSPKAQKVLEQVAAKIDASDATTVKVDGHTDDSGTDQINDPLSRRRADAVRDKLTELVTKEGVTYQVRGHGSSDPLVPNSSEENRKRNRRVSVTFAR